MSSAPIGPQKRHHFPRFTPRGVQIRSTVDPGSVGVEPTEAPKRTSASRAECVRWLPRQTESVLVCPPSGRLPRTECKICSLGLHRRHRTHSAREALVRFGAFVGSTPTLPGTTVLRICTPPGVNLGKRCRFRGPIGAEDMRMLMDSRIEGAFSLGGAYVPSPLHRSGRPDL